MKLRHQARKCCVSPDVKNEGKVVIGNKVSWEYHCYNCNQTWTEITNKSGKIKTVLLFV